MTMGVVGTAGFNVTNVIDLSSYSQNTAYQCPVNGLLILNYYATVQNVDASIYISNDGGSTYKQYQDQIYGGVAYNPTTRGNITVPINKNDYFKYIVSGSNVGVLRFDLHKVGY